MNKMKLIGIILFAIGLTNCASAKFAQKPPFIVQSATYTNVVGGLPNSGYTTINIFFSADKNINFQEIFFNNKKVKATIETSKRGTEIVGKFYASQNFNDLQLHGDPKKEFGNKPPKANEKLPFELKKNEAVISYKEGDKLKYYKIENVQKGKSAIMQ